MAKTGRPSDALRHRFQGILESANAYERIRQILMQTKREDIFLRCVEICADRAFGKPLQVNENFNHDDDPERPTTEALIETIRTLRDELKSSREGTGVAAEK